MLVGVHRETLRRWVDLGCPVVKRGGRRSRKGGWILSVPDVVAWRLEQVAREAGAASQTVSLAEAERRKKVAKAELAEIALARARTEFVSVTDVGEIVGAEYQVARRKLRALPGRLAVQVRAAGSDEEAEDLLAEGIDECLEELSAAPDHDDPAPDPSPLRELAARSPGARTCAAETWPGDEEFVT
jgi:hypothetical protein